MSDVNFLPESYRRQVASQQRRKRQVMLAVVLSLCLGGWLYVQVRQTHRLEAVAADLDRQLGAARNQRSELVKLREEHAILRHQRAIRQELAQPIQSTQVIGLLADLLPSDVAIHELKLVTRRPEPEAIEDPKAKKRAKQPEDKKPVVDVISIDIEGLAPDDMTIAEAVASLQDHPLFRNVKMHYAREVERFDLIAREFKISAELPLGIVVRSPRAGEGLADAD